MSSQDQNLNDNEMIEVGRDDASCLGEAFKKTEYPPHFQEDKRAILGKLLG